MLIYNKINWQNAAVRESLPGALYAPCNQIYQKAYMEDWEFEDLSFGIYDSSQCLAYMLLTYGTHTDGQRVINWFGLPAICAFPHRLTRDIEMLLTTYFSSLLKKFANCRITFREYMQNGVLSPVALYMLERGAACATQFSCDINLQVQVEDIWRNIRKSFKPLINKSKKLLSHTLVTAQTITPDCIEEFKALHLAAAGRRTRNDLSWDIQLQQIRNNDAFIIMSYFGTELVGASFYLMPFRRCDYGVGAYKRELFKEMPIAHGAMWEAILYAKSSNCHYFDVGPYYFSFQLNTVSEKEMSIGIFRKGFTEYISPTFLLNLN